MATAAETILPGPMKEFKDHPELVIGEMDGVYPVWNSCNQVFSKFFNISKNIKLQEPYDKIETVYDFVRDSLREDLECDFKYHPLAFTLEGASRSALIIMTASLELCNGAELLDDINKNLDILEKSQAEKVNFEFDLDLVIDECVEVLLDAEVEDTKDTPPEIHQKMLDIIYENFPSLKDNWIVTLGVMEKIHDRFVNLQQ